MCSEILTLYHQDGGDRLTRRVQRFDTDEDRQFAADRASTLDEALTLYAEDMRCHAPRSLSRSARSSACAQVTLGRPARCTGAYASRGRLGNIDAAARSNCWARPYQFWSAGVRPAYQAGSARARSDAGGLGRSRQVRDPLTPCVRRCGQTSSGRRSVWGRLTQHLGGLIGLSERGLRGGFGWWTPVPRQ